ncbi:MAG: hypothetical protein HY774_04885 [Acidobacteria bacterium]|nr:hypothetical protein [Acidobacteriota bacterium]
MSKFRFSLCVFALAISLGFGAPQAQAQQPAAQAEAKIAFVNSLEFGENIIEFRQQTEILEREFKPANDQLEKLAEQLQLDEEALRRTLQDLQPGARQRRVEELEKAKKDYNRRVEDLKETIGKRSIVALDPLRPGHSQARSNGVPGSGFRVPGSGFRVPGSGFRVPGSGFRVPGSGFFEGMQPEG